jgi:hypothetical protein
MEEALIEGKLPSPGGPGVRMGEGLGVRADAEMRLRVRRKRAALTDRWRRRT